MHIEFFNREEVQGLYSRVSALVNNQVSSSSERIFNWLIPEHLAIKIDSLHIDVGTISYTHFEQEFTERYEAALEKELAKHLQRLEHEPGDNIVPVATKLKENYMALLHHFLRTGTIPWWAAGSKFKDIRSLFAQLLQEEPAPVKNLLLEIGIYEAVRYRLAYQFPEETMHRVITLLEPAQAPFIFNYHHDVVAVQKNEQLVKSESSSFEKALWLFILTYLLVEKGSHFNRKMFVKSALFQLAAQFNSTYENILYIFSEALVSQKQDLKEHDTLLTLIHELSLENAYTQPGHSLATGDLFSTLAGIEEQLSYYFLVGSLPVNSSIKNEQELVRLFVQLKQAAPRRAAFLLKTIGKHAAARKRMLAVFEEALLKEIVLFTESAHSEFILNYLAALTGIQKLKAATGAGSSEFRQAAWQAVLYLVFERQEPVFEPAVFIEHTLRYLALHYHLDYKLFLLAFVQGMGENPQLHNDNSQLFYQLTGLLKIEQGQHSVAPFFLNATYDKAIQPGQRTIHARDTLLYWLQHYVMPWWISEGSGSPTAVFEELLATDPASAILVLKFAARENSRKALFLSALPQPLILKLMARLPDSGPAAELLALFVDLAFAAKQEMQAEQIRVVLLSVVLDVYHVHAFSRFDRNDFLTASLQQLAALWHMNISGVATLLLKHVQQQQNRSYPSVLLAVLNAGKENNISPLTAGAPVYTGLSETNVSAALAQLKKKHKAPKELITEALAILSYFLTWHKLPEGLNQSQLQTDELLRELLKLLAEESRLALHTLLLKKDHAAMARLHLHSLFATYTGMDAQPAKTLLAVFYKTDVINYLREKSIVVKNEFAQEALAILRYFLMYNAFPGELAGNQNFQTDAFLRELLSIAVHENKTALRDLLLKTGHATTARLRLHDIFMSYPHADAEPIKSILVDFFRSDLIYYLREKNILIQQDSDLAGLLDIFLKHPFDKNNSASLQQLFQSPAMLHLVSRHSPDEKFYALIHYFATEKDTAFIRGIRYVLDLLGSDKAGRETLGGLLREFSLRYFMNNSSAFNQTAFIKSFFAFLQTKNQLSGRQLYTGLLRAKTRLTGFTNSEALLLILNDMTQETKHYADKETAGLALQQELKRSAEDLLKELKDEKKEKENASGNEDPWPEAGEEEQKKEEPVIMEKMYVKNAGLVILHPFLSTYFTRVQLMEDGKFINETSRQRAVHLLQYIVWETQQHAEEELALNKLLCGLPVHAPLPDGIEITEAEKKVSQELINVVIMQWDKLQNTSAEGFRTSFLQREGLLSENEETYSLRVEQRGYDVLLQSLPWNLGLIKTSWMLKPLLIEWT